MSALKIFGIVLIVSGILGLFYGSFTYRNENSVGYESRTEPVGVSIRENKAVNIPIWLGVGAIIIGGMIVFFENKKNDVLVSTIHPEKF